MKRVKPRKKREVIIRMDVKTYRYIMKMVLHEKQSWGENETISTMIHHLISFWASTQNECDQVGDDQ